MDLSVFMICNHPTVSYKECCLKLDLCKYWNVKVNDCYFDNQLSPNIEPIAWTYEQIKLFRSKVRKHNQIVNFGIDSRIMKCAIYIRVSKDEMNLDNQKIVLEEYAKRQGWDYTTFEEKESTGKLDL